MSRPRSLGRVVVVLPLPINPLPPPFLFFSSPTPHLLLFSPHPHPPHHQPISHPHFTSFISFPFPSHHFFFSFPSSPFTSLLLVFPPPALPPALAHPLSYGVVIWCVHLSGACFLFTRGHFLWILCVAIFAIYFFDLLPFILSRFTPARARTSTRCWGLVVPAGFGWRG